MEEKRRWGVLVCVGISLVVAIVAYLTSGRWAAASPRGDMTIPAPATKDVDKPLLLPTHDAVFDLDVGVPGASLVWLNVVLTDTIDSYLTITGVTSSQGVTQTVGQAVTVALGTMPAGTTASVDIFVTVNGDAPYGQLIPNVAYVIADEFPEVQVSDPVTITVGYPRYFPLAMKTYSAP